MTKIVGMFSLFRPGTRVRPFYLTVLNLRTFSILGTSRLRTIFPLYLFLRLFFHTDRTEVETQFFSLSLFLLLLLFPLLFLLLFLLSIKWEGRGTFTFPVGVHLKPRPKCEGLLIGSTLYKIIQRFYLCSWGPEDCLERSPDWESDPDSPKGVWL